MEFSNTATIKSNFGLNVETNKSNIVNALLDTGTVVITKNQSTDILKPGQIQTYTVTMTNNHVIKGTLNVFTDIIPVGMSYVQDSFTFNGAIQTPTSILNNILIYNFANWEVGATVTISFQAQTNLP